MEPISQFEQSSLLPFSGLDGNERPPEWFRSSAVKMVKRLGYRKDAAYIFPEACDEPYKHAVNHWSFVAPFLRNFDRRDLKSTNGIHFSASASFFAPPL